MAKATGEGGLEHYPVILSKDVYQELGTYSSYHIEGRLPRQHGDLP